MARTVAVSEDGGEILTARLWNAEEYRAYDWDDSSTSIQMSHCAVEWRAYETGDLLAMSPFERECYTKEVTSDTDPIQAWNWFLGSMSP